ncbi:UDP-glucose 4-epimerase GalE [Kribbella sp. NPDC005582]|uniref:UDP-glucose 4-epimerase GalE n=1 Tax=Kribbella sp. NPDC005582 TaxID=3156893 RepID=UPI0033B096F1
MTWMITGGAGYIGSHVVQAMLEGGMDVVVIDDLSTGFANFVPADVPLVRSSILDRRELEQTIAKYGVEGVIHAAGFKYAGVSVQQPLHVYAQNVTGTATLLQAMLNGNVDKLVFSSSCATFGSPDVDEVTETTPARPESPYGESKLIGEWLIADVARSSQLTHTSLRYFNVVGSGHAGLYDASPHNLFPLVFDALTSGVTPTIFGVDYPTPDGTCVRDYVHVADLAHSHLIAAQKLAAGKHLEPVYNLGSGTGWSVRQVMDTIREVTAIDFTPAIRPRRPGDPARIAASGELARRDLEWVMRHDLESMVRSSWRSRLAAGSASPVGDISP